MHGFLKLSRAQNIVFSILDLTSVIVSLGHAGSTAFLAAQLSFVNFVLREEFAFLFQTFSRNDLPGEAPPTRGCSVFKKKKKKKKKRRTFFKGNEKEDSC